MLKYRVVVISHVLNIDATNCYTRLAKTFQIFMLWNPFIMRPRKDDTRKRAALACWGHFVKYHIYQYISFIKNMEMYVYWFIQALFHREWFNSISPIPEMNNVPKMIDSICWRHLGNTLKLCTLVMGIVTPFCAMTPYKRDWLAQICIRLGCLGCFLCWNLFLDVTKTNKHITQFCGVSMQNI